MTTQKHRFKWTEVEKKAFTELQARFFNDPFLCTPNLNEKFVLQCDASRKSIGSALLQKKDGILVPIAYFSKKLNACQSKYGVTKLEIYAIHLSVRHFREYLIGRTFTILTDHECLKFDLKISNPCSVMDNWLLELSQYDYKIKYIKGEENYLADYLSRMETDSNQTDSKGIESKQTLREQLIDHSQSTGIVATRSEEVARQVECSMTECKEGEEMLPFPQTRERINVVTTRSNFIDISIERFKREQLRDPEITQFMENITQQDLRKKSRKTENFFIDKDTGLLMNLTYQRKGILLQTIVVPTVLQKEVLRAVHLTHFGISKCFERLKREYFWIGMFGDLKNFVLSCDRCAREKNSRQKRYPTGKTYIPFQPGTDLFADITYVKDSNHYILTIICSYSKFLATYLLTNIKATTIAEKFIDYFTKFSKPVSIQTDLGTQFTSEIFQEINRILGVELKNSLAYSAFQNGKIERCHTSLKNTLATLKLDKYSLDLRVKLHTSFYNTSFHEAINAIPSEVFFGREMTALLDNNVSLVERTQLSVDNYIHKMSRELKTVYAEVRQELIEKQEKQTENLINKSTKIAPMLGDTVFVINEGIFTKGFDGPYTVVCLNSKSILTLNDKKTNRDFKISVSKIKIVPQRREHLL